MTKILSLASVLALFAGCTGVSDKDTGDTAGDTDTTGDTDTNGTPAFAFAGDPGFAGDCANGLCIYRITTTAEGASFELDMTETADTTYLYNENHTAFELETENSDGTLTYRLDLDWVTDLADVVVNETTLFNPDVRADLLSARTTWYFGGTGTDGNMDCRVTGHDPAYYADWCTTVVR